MSTSSVISNLAHPFGNVKPSVLTQLPLFSDSMIHHNKGRGSRGYIVLRRGDVPSPSYGVSQSRRVLSPQLLLKRYDRIRDCLQYVIGLTTAQREAALRLLRFWAYYGNIYVKESTITAEPGCSKATYWRTVKLLERRGLLTVLNRYVIRPHAQISNLYRFDKLLILLARYLAEHGVVFYKKWLQPYLAMPGSQFWPLLWQSRPQSSWLPGGVSSEPGSPS